MAYWLCDKRRQQKSSPVMRFDPRFWTVNFPRPMMASVVTTGPESLRAEAVFYRHLFVACGRKKPIQAAAMATT
jgi:hypothetical protein